jgi:periplasmic divalent cation tolerance protein
VTNQLAACVNILPKMVSIYEWQEKLEKGQEHQMVIKTRSQLVPKIEQLISKQHPYELAELLVLPVVSGSKDFLTWITETTHEK